MNRDVLMYLLKKLDEEIDILNVDAGRGTAKEFGDYKFACGVIRGLYKAKAEVIQLIETLEKGDE